MTLPWTRTSSRRRREIIQRVGEAQQPLRAMRTKARDGFIKALLEEGSLSGSGAATTGSEFRMRPSCGTGRPSSLLDSKSA